EIEQNLGDDNNQNSEKENSEKSNDKEEDANMIENDYKEEIDKIYKRKMDYEAEEEVNEIDDNSTRPSESDIAIHDNSSNETMNAPFAEQEFCSWDDLDHFILFYTKSQNFVSVIRRLEYSDGICRNRRYACEHQGHSGTNKTSIAENQWQTHSKCIGCQWQVQASCPKTMGILKFNS
ncbi:10037_t:CDS:2, partial [Cetraspora pellucida]